MFELNNKIALVTGATGGIGESIVETLIKQGTTVVITGRNLEKLETLKNKLQDKIHIIESDLKNPNAAKELIETTVKTYGKLDILVNNAGFTHDTLMMRMKDDDWQSVIDVNLTATFKLSREAIMPMIKNKFGRIINITSIVGWTGNAGQANYCASKAGITGLSKALAIEIASRNITVNCIAPGFIITPMTDILPEEIKTKTMEQIPSKRFGTPQDVANAVVFLSSEESSYITGQTIHINGGMFRL